MTTQMNEEQIIENLEKLSPRYKRKALRKLIGDLGEMDTILEQNRKKLDAICEEQGIDFDSLEKDQREALIDRIIHEE